SVRFGEVCVPEQLSPPVDALQVSAPEMAPDGPFRFRLRTMLCSGSSAGLPRSWLSAAWTLLVCETWPPKVSVTVAVPLTLLPLAARFMVLVTVVVWAPALPATLVCRLLTVARLRPGIRAALAAADSPALADPPPAEALVLAPELAPADALPPLP